MIKPVKKYLLLEKEVVDNQASSGIILSAEEKEEKNVAKVLATGDEVKEINVGDVVIFESYSTKEIEYNEEKYLIIEDEKVIAKIQ